MTMRERVILWRRDMRSEHDRTLLSGRWPGRATPRRSAAAVVVSCESAVESWTQKYKYQVEVTTGLLINKNSNTPQLRLNIAFIGQVGVGLESESLKNQ